MRLTSWREIGRQMRAGNYRPMQERLDWFVSNGLAGCAKHYYKAKTIEEARIMSLELEKSPDCYAVCSLCHPKRKRR